VFVSLSVRDRISGTRPTCPILPIFVPVTYSRGSVPLWWRCDTLCASGLMDDVILHTLGHMGHIEVQRVTSLRRRAHCTGYSAAAASYIIGCGVS